MAPLLLDKQAISVFYGDAADVITDILTDYRNNIPETVGSFRIAFAKGSDNLRSVAHFHASAFSYVGFPQLHNECKALEQACKQTADVANVRQALESLISRIEESGHLIKLELQQLQPASI